MEINIALMLGWFFFLSLVFNGFSSGKFNEVKEGFINVSGGKIWYKIVGLGKPGIPLLVIHGGPGATHDYLQPIEKIADERPVIFYDQLGGGKSDRPSDTSLWNIERFVDELAIIRNELKLDRVHLLGQSWGTTLATEYMLTQKPGGVVSIVFAAPCISVSRWINDQKDYLLQMEKEIQDIINECELSGDYSSPDYQNAMMIYYRKHLCMLDEWPECLQRTFANMGADVYAYMWGPSEFTVTGKLKSLERAERLNEIKVPALFTCGRYDEASPESTEYYHKSMPGSEFYIFEDASHSHHLEKEEEFLSVLRSFIKRAEENQ